MLVARKRLAQLPFELLQLTAGLGSGKGEVNE
jgi:hypothetical protein